MCVVYWEGRRRRKKNGSLTEYAEVPDYMEYSMRRECGQIKEGLESLTELIHLTPARENQRIGVR